MTYDLSPLKAPRAAGTLLRALATAAESPVVGPALAGKLLADLGLETLRSLHLTEPMPVRPPLFEQAPSAAARGSGKLDLAAAAAVPRGQVPGETAADFVAAYRAGHASPVEVAQRVLAAARDSDRLTPPMRLFVAQDEQDVLAQARASQERWRRGEPLSVLDGVPVGVKDELDQLPYPTQVGTRFLGQSPARADAETVARLRRLGALLIGKLNMHEIGLGVTGLNPHHGSARNPYDPSRATGGSSSASAAAVAAGLCPIALGADAGGSIRIPSSLCGVVGLKPTFGRVSETGAAPLCWSLAHVGPLARSAADAALAYAVMAGPDPQDPNSLLQPPPHLDGFGNTELSRVKIGVFRPWFEDAEPAVVGACREVVEGLRRRGAQLVEVELEELGALRVAHLVTVVTEMASAQLEHLRAGRDRYSPETRLLLAVAGQLRAHDYVHAQRFRARVFRRFAEVLARVDVIAVPATGRTAPPIREDTLDTGESNVEVSDQILRFSLPANLTGLPAISFPAGYDAQGLPVGLQLIGRPWEEHLLLELARAAEGLVARRPPSVSYSLLRG